MNFEQKLENYANLLISHGINVQPGQVVNITSEICHRELVQKMVRAAYRCGAKFVHVDFVDPILARLRVEESHSEEFLRYVPPYTTAKYDHFVDDNAAVIRLVGSEDPHILADLPAKKVNDLQTYFRQCLKRYYAEGIGKSKVQWTVAAASTPAWGQLVFPELPPQAAHEALWEAIFKICHVDQPNYLGIWDKHQKSLIQKAKDLTNLQIKELHFTGPGTDLRVGLSPQAVFKGGGDSTPQGVAFEANIPTEECFTTPDYRRTEGRVRVTRPVSVNGKLIKGLEVEFKQGEIVNFSAEEGYDQFAAYIESDKGAKRLGEVALVGIDSPIYQSQRLFGEILFDENAACHIAVGFAYRFCIDGGSAMTAEELEAIGCNDSHVHTDFMISSENVDVKATTYDGKELLIISQGRWNNPNFRL